MEQKEFEEIIRDKIQSSLNTLLQKNSAYNPQSDKLGGFKRSAAMRSTTPADALGGMMLKHTTSIYDMIGATDTDFPMDVWEEKIGDHINYLLLLQCIIWEQKNEASDVVEDGDREGINDPSLGVDYNRNLEAPFEANATTVRGKYRVMARVDPYDPSKVNVRYGDGSGGQFDINEVSFDDVNTGDDVPQWNGADKAIMYPYVVQSGDFKLLGFDNLRDLAAYFGLRPSEFRHAYRGEIDGDTYYVAGAYYRKVSK